MRRSEELNAYFQTKKDTHFDRFQELRADSWQRITKLLKLSEKGREIEKKVKK